MVIKIEKDKEIDEKDIDVPSKIDLGDIIPLMEKIKKTDDLYEKNKILYDILRKIPEEHITLKNVVKEMLCDDEKFITKREFNDIWKKTHKELKILESKKKGEEKLKEIGESIETFIYDNDTEIRQTENGIYYVIKSKSKFGFIYTEPQKVLKGKLEILSYTNDPITNLPLYNIKFRGFDYNTIDISTFINLFKEYILHREFGRDIIRVVFDESRTPDKKRKAETILGFNDGWKLPQNEDENGFSLICTTDYHKRAYKSASKMIKIYSEKEKEHYIKYLKAFIKRTQMNEIKMNILIGWFLAAPFRKFFIDYLHIFPFLHLDGVRSSGKSYLANFWGIHFYDLWENGLQNSILKSLARFEDYLSTSTFPLAINEVESIQYDIIPLIKEYCTGSPNYDRKKGLTGSILKPEVAPFSIDTNKHLQQLMDYAMNSKSIHLNFSEEDKIERDEKWVEYYDYLKNKKLFSFVYDKTKNWKNKDIKDIIKKLQEELSELSFDDSAKNYARLKQIYLIIIFGLRILKISFDIKLEEKGILDYLIKARENMGFELLDEFKTFCFDVRYYKNEKRSLKCPFYINHSFITPKVINAYYFYKNNLNDFSDYIRKFGENPYRGIESLCNLLIDALPKEEKNYLKYTNYANTWSIKIDEKFFPTGEHPWDERYKKDEELYPESKLEKDDGYVDAEDGELDY